MYIYVIIVLRIPECEDKVVVNESELTKQVTAYLAYAFLSLIIKRGVLWDRCDINASQPALQHSVIKRYNLITTHL